MKPTTVSTATASLGLSYALIQLLSSGLALDGIVMPADMQTALLTVITTLGHVLMSRFGIDPETLLPVVPADTVVPAAPAPAGAPGAVAVVAAAPI